MKNLAFVGAMIGLVLVGACSTYNDGPDRPDGCAKSATVTVVNPVDVPRTETVSVSWKELGIKSSTVGLRVFDLAAGKAIPHQNDAEGNFLLLVKPEASTKAITYYAGANWSGQKRYTRACCWQKYVKDFAFCLRNPLKVTVKSR